jgi:hypothetical protein
MDKGELKCEFCGTVMPESRRKYKNQVCNQECRKGLTKAIEAEEKERFYLTRKVNKDNGRRCRTCGENCWPNYFYCNKHIREDGSGYGI